MKVYLVGGAVRDQLLSRPVVDRDWVVVGSTMEEMAAAGYQQVGDDFPVFLHPETSEAYALARTERRRWDEVPGRVASPSRHVTLEEDLSRRDLTINAMAQDLDGSIIDPYGGQADLQSKVLRHVSAAFADDPMRILRMARFAARYQGFRVAEDTVQFCRDMVAAGALDKLVPERVWQELARGLMEDKPSLMFEVLRQCDALRVVLPELDRLWGVPQPTAHHPEIDTGVHVMMVLDAAASAGAPLVVRYAALLHDLGKGITPAPMLPAHHGHEEEGLPLVKAVNRRWKVPTELADMAYLVAGEHTRVHRALDLKATSLVQLLGRVDVYRRPERLDWLLQACRFDAIGRLGFEQRAYPQQDRIRQAAAAVRSVNVAEVVRSVSAPKLIPEAIYTARVAAVKAALS